MTYLHTCVGCSQALFNCPLATKLREALRDLGVSSARHRCSARVPLYKLGDAVEALTVAFQGSDEYGEEAPRGWFPGVFISQHSTKCVAFVKPGTPMSGHSNEFETNGRGFVKVPLSRIRRAAHEVPDPRLCRHCGNYVGLTGACGDPNPVWARSSFCKLPALQSTSTSGEG